MIDRPPRSPDAERIALKASVIELAAELSESGEVFPFPGLNPEMYALIKAEQAKNPGFTTPIDELIARFETEGVKVVLTKYPESGNFILLPAGSDNIFDDMLMPDNLVINSDSDSELSTLLTKKESLAGVLAETRAKLDEALQEQARYMEQLAQKIKAAGYEILSIDGAELYVMKDGYVITLRYFGSSSGIDHQEGVDVKSALYRNNGPAGDQFKEYQVTTEGPDADEAAVTLYTEITNLLNSANTKLPPE